MVAMKIENFIGTADTFTFPNNPGSYDLSLDSNYQITQVAFKDYNIFASGGGSLPKGIVLDGFLHGSSRWTNFRLLSKHFGQSKILKKLYFESDKFYIGLGKQIKQTNSGGRTNFVDYVANFQTVINLLFGNTLRTSGTNAGNAITYVEKIVGTVTNGSVDVTVTDGLGNSFSIDSSIFATGQEVIMNLVTMVDVGNGVNVTTFRYVTVAGSRVTRVKTLTGDGLPRIDAAANVSTINTTNLTSDVVSFRDAYYM